MIGFRPGQWHVVATDTEGKWLAIHDSPSCMHTQRVVLNRQVSYVPKCTRCGYSDAKVDVHAERERFFVAQERAKYLRRGA